MLWPSRFGKDCFHNAQNSFRFGERVPASAVQNEFANRCKEIRVRSVRHCGIQLKMMCYLQFIYL